MMRSHRIISRRNFLHGAVSAGIGFAGPGFVGQAEAQQSTVSFGGWAFEPQVVEANVKRFMEQKIGRAHV